MTSTYLKRVLKRDLEGLRAQIKAYPEENRLWEIPAGISNSGGTLALHLVGNVRHYIGAHIGGSGYVRDRDAEFRGRNISVSDIEESIDSAIEEVSNALGLVTDEMMEHEYPIAVLGTRLSTGQFLIHLVNHFGYHLGQLDYHRRMTTGINEAVGGGQIAALMTG
ncbi:MAG: DinB family protein [Rhodothermia bacterium]